MNLEPIKSVLLGSASHGFFTRVGGVSGGIFAELNCGYGSPEDRTIVQQNRNLIAANIGVSEDRLFSVTQTHSANVITIDDPTNFRPDAEADAMVTNGDGIALAVLTADCAPILFHDGSTGVVGAAHAGWRGAFGGVLEATIERMCALGAVRHQINAVVGPCISQKNYEVGQEFFEAFLDSNPRFSRFFVNAPNEKYLFDLPAFVLEQLCTQEIGQTEWTGHCTYADPKRFYSYRYSQHNGLPSYGRHLSVITK